VAEATAQLSWGEPRAPGWRALALGDVAKLQAGYAFKSSWFAPAGVRLLRGTNIEPGRTRWIDVVYLSQSHASEFASYALVEGDIVIAMDRPIISSGLKLARINGEDVPALLLQRVGRFRCGPDIDAGFLFQYLRSPAFLNHIDAQSTGTQLPHISATDIETSPLSLPPLDEQKRIVTKLEALQIRSRRAREALEAVPPLLEKLRQSILAAAFRGDLTKEWRAKHPDVEPATELLKRIRVERRKKWEQAELAKMTAKGKVPGDERWKARYKEPAPVDASGLPQLPGTWCWASVEEVSLVGGGLTKNAAQRAAGVEVPLVSVAAVQLRKIVIDDISSIRASVDDGDNGQLLRGDVLIVEGNGSLSHIGRVAIWNAEVEAARHQNHIIRVRPVMLSSEYVLEWLASPLGRAVIVRRATSASGLYTLSISKVEQLPIPIAPDEEARAVPASLDASIGRLATMAQASFAFRERLSALDRSILSCAFRGDVVFRREAKPVRAPL
jgi:type I restriction enzyme S subunit